MLRGLRRPRDEAQLTRALAGVFAADQSLAGQFVGIVLDASPFAARKGIPAPPDRLACRAEEIASEGRADLTFRDAAGHWHVIVELKVDAGYGPRQLERYLRAFGGARHEALAAVTRNVPTRGDPPEDADRRWAGSVRWGRVLRPLRDIRPGPALLAREWPLFLDVLESEGSMGFTKADIDLFRAWERAVPARDHAVDLVDALQVPLLEALRDALGAMDPVERGAATDLYTVGQKKRTVQPSQKIIELRFRVPAGGATAVRCGLFAHNANLRFFVAPGFPAATLPDEAHDARRALVASGFRPSDLHAFLVLDDETLARETLQEELVEWAAAHFRDLVDSGLLRFGRAVDTLVPPEELADEEDV